MSTRKGVSRTTNFCGLDFWNGSLHELMRQMRTSGGYLVVPSAPSFTYMQTDSDFEVAMRSADYAIVDSGYMAIFMAILLRQKVNRFSGLRLLQHLFVYDEEPWCRDARILWVSPSAAESDRIASFLKNREFDLSKQTFYEAPVYSSVPDYRDARLRELIQTIAPELIVLGIAGGKQEKLGFELTRMVSDCPPVICTGAAIAFLTGGQARIPTWADRCYLGWLFRICRSPREFLPRYVRAFWALPLAVARYHIAPSPSVGSVGRN